MLFSYSTAIPSSILGLRIGTTSCPFKFLVARSTRHRARAGRLPRIPRRPSAIYWTTSFVATSVFITITLPVATSSAIFGGSTNTHPPVFLRSRPTCYRARGISRPTAPTSPRTVHWACSCATTISGRIRCITPRDTSLPPKPSTFARKIRSFGECFSAGPSSVSRDLVIAEIATESGCESCQPEKSNYG